MVSKYHRNFAFDTVADIAKQTSLPEIGAVFAREMAKLGINALGINGLPPPEPDADPIVVAEIVPEGFREYYVHERFYLIDPNVAHIRTTFDPFRFSDAFQNQVKSESRERFMQVLSSYGMGEGLMIPVGRTANIPTCVWLAGKDLNLDDDALQMMQLISLFAASKAESVFHRHDNDGEPLLTAREREVLTWAAHGKSSWEIGQILHIAKRTVDEHTQAATRKLGAANRTQAVVLAMLRRILMWPAPRQGAHGFKFSYRHKCQLPTRIDFGDIPPVAGASIFNPDRRIG
jgi:LuxR family quorum sensing-dependent transcriptional regulator